MFKRILLIFLFVLGMNLLSFGQTVFKENLPEDWSIHKHVTVSADQVSAFSKKLGGQISSLENYVIDTTAGLIQINVVQCENEREAENVYNTFLSIYQSPEAIFRDMNRVYEFRADNILIMKKAKSLFDGIQEVTVWDVRLKIAPVKKSSDMEVNTLFNLFLDYQKDKENSKIKENILQISKKFEFDNTITFCNRFLEDIKPEYQIANCMIKRETPDLIIFEVKDPEKELDIPKVEVNAFIPVKPFTPYIPLDKVESLYYTSPTAYWPSGHPRILDLSDNILKGIDAPLEKLNAIQDWVYQNIKYDGVTGSRYGVIKVLEQGFGRCWDKNDVLVTLCRAAGLPARQVQGWVYGKSGHIWSEVYINNRGWVSVDATVPFLGISKDYIPFFMIENGEVPAVYWDLPTIKKVQKK